MTRGSGKAELCRAVLEGIAFEVADLVQTMNEAAPVSISELRVDGGACVSDFMMQFQADLLRLPVNRPENVESTALGAAFLAGLAAGVWSSRKTWNTSAAHSRSSSRSWPFRTGTGRCKTGIPP